MRKVVESTLVTADGVAGEPHTWTGDHFGADAVERALEQMRRSEIMVMGRGTYERFSTLWAEPTNEYAAAIHGIRKYVFSSTMTRADWNNTEVVAGDVAATVAELKAGDGGDIILYGHGGIGQALLEAGLIDELRLCVHPLVLGQGAPLLRPGSRVDLDLLGTDTTATGVVVLTYRPTRPDGPTTAR